MVLLDQLLTIAKRRNPLSGFLPRRFPPRCVFGGGKTASLCGGGAAQVLLVVSAGVVPVFCAADTLQAPSKPTTKGEMATENFRNQLEPSGLLQQFQPSSRRLCLCLKEWPAPAFTAPFDLLTTAEDAPQGASSVAARQSGRWLSSRLRLKTDFIGSTVMSMRPCPRAWMLKPRWQRQLRAVAGRTMLTIVKDLPQASPLLSASDNDLPKPCLRHFGRKGFWRSKARHWPMYLWLCQHGRVSGRPVQEPPQQPQAQAQEPRASPSSVSLPAQLFAADAQVDAYYALFDAVYAQSDIHFDKLTRGFLPTYCAMRTTAASCSSTGIGKSDALLGWNLCFEHDGRLDRQIHRSVLPAAREANLYFVSWMVNPRVRTGAGPVPLCGGLDRPGSQGPARRQLHHDAASGLHPQSRAARLWATFSGLFESDRQWADKP